MNAKPRTDIRWGFLRETQKEIDKDPYDPVNGYPRTCLIDYLREIFPNTHDWIHNKGMQDVKGLNGRLRPDCRSDSLKLLIEFDGVQHYTNPEQIIKDREHTRLYRNAGYFVVRIPYFIQLTTATVNEMFWEVLTTEFKKDLFDPSVASVYSGLHNTPAFLCYLGLKRMAEDFIRYPEQYEVNLQALRAEANPDLTGIDILEQEVSLLKSRLSVANR